MNKVKSFEEFINEVWFKGPESYYRLRDMYINDPSFRRKVDTGTLDTEMGANDRITPNDDEVFYGVLSISINANPIEKEKTNVTMHCLTDNPKELYGSVKSQELMSVIDKFEAEVGKEEFEHAWIGSSGNSIYAKVSVKKRPGGVNKAVITHLLKVYRNGDECEQDMIETLRKKSDN